MYSWIKARMKKCCANYLFNSYNIYMYIDIDSSRNFEAGFRCILDVQFLQMILTREIFWHLSQSCIWSSNMVLHVLLFAIWDRASVSLLLLSAKQGNNWYHYFEVRSIFQGIQWLQIDTCERVLSASLHCRTRTHSVLSLELFSGMFPICTSI